MSASSEFYYQPSGPNKYQIWASVFCGLKGSQQFHVATVDVANAVNPSIRFVNNRTGDGTQTVALAVKILDYVRSYPWL